MDDLDYVHRPPYGRAGFDAPHAWLADLAFSPQDFLPFGEDLRLRDGVLQVRLRSPSGQEVGWQSLCRGRAGQTYWRHTHHQRRGVFRSPGTRPTQVVLTTNILDALAFAAVNPPAPSTVILACNDVWCPLMVETMVALASPDLDIVHVASGFDDAGFNLQSEGFEVLDRLPNCEAYALFALPHGKRWLEDLRVVRGQDGVGTA